MLLNQRTGCPESLSTGQTGDTMSPRASVNLFSGARLLDVAQVLDGLAG